jgi:DNA repair exonuclease SbcCD ATPase subunit
MNALNFIQNKMRACIRTRGTDSSAELALYRRLRHAENELHEARESLNRTLAAQQDTTGPDIENLQREVARLEAEYQSAQKNVRAYFYLQACPGGLMESETAAGHPA